MDEKRSIGREGVNEKGHLVANLLLFEKKVRSVIIYVSLSLCQPACLSACMSLCLYLSVCLSLWPSPTLSHSPIDPFTHPSLCNRKDRKIHSRFTLLTSWNGYVFAPFFDLSVYLWWVGQIHNGRRSRRPLCPILHFFKFKTLPLFLFVQAVCESDRNF